MLGLLEAKNVSGNLFLSVTHQKVLQVLKQADYLQPKYHVVIANPPYMGKGMNGRLGTWAQTNYPCSKSDLFAMFIERGLEMIPKQCYCGMITMQSWMFLSVFERLRVQILNDSTILSMAHLGARAFDSIGGEVVSTTAFVAKRAKHLEYRGSYLGLTKGDNEAEKIILFKEKCVSPLLISANDFKKIPGTPIAYWVSRKVLDIFSSGLQLEDISISDGQNITANNDKYLRYHWEVSQRMVGNKDKWMFYAKGGEFRNWWGNLEHVVDWSEEARSFYRRNNSARIIPEYLWYRAGITWTLLSSGKTGFRYLPEFATFDKTGSSIFLKKTDDISIIIGLLASKIGPVFLNIFSSTIAFQIKEIRQIPLIDNYQNLPIKHNCDRLLKISQADWDSYEASWDFTSLPLLHPDYRQSTLKSTYIILRTYSRKVSLEMKQLEEENNRIFVEAYGLQAELTSEIPLREITLTCNPYYRYGGDKTEEKLESLLLADTMREFISYAVGCMFGRYSLDKSGLILANQGETVQDYLKQIPEPTFPADDDNVIPILDGDWFTDDISERFRKFLRVTFGHEHYEENLKFIEKAIGKDIRKFFTRDFYNDHVKRYKKRPIYWLFSSPQGSFNALIYMHRYRPDTISIILNDYLREFRTKLSARVDHLEQISISTSASQGEKTKALKEIEQRNKTINELETWEREILYPLATQQIEIDLDDGVKVNYNKFGKALKKVAGLSQ